MHGSTVISVDGMGGDLGPAPLIAAMARAVRADTDLRFILHGDEAILSRLLSRRPKLAAACDLRHADDVVSMSEKPSRALRTGRRSSLWGALQSVADGDARIALTAGNTGAIVAMSMLALRRAPGVNRPAIAVHWPSRTAQGFNIVLDVGADVRADAKSLLQFAVMGAEYARLSLGVERPRVGLLNVGAEETKGRQELHEAKELIEAKLAEVDPGFDFVGYIEGNDILSDRINVVVTDGFTGNIAMKAAEGTATFIREALKQAFSHSILSQIGSLFALTSLKRLRKRIDPRRVNGGVFLGLNGAVVKSHGSSDAVGYGSAIDLAVQMASRDFPSHVAEQLAMLEEQGFSGAKDGELRGNAGG